MGKNIFAMDNLKLKILVLIDFSTYSKDLLKTAEAWGAVLKAEIVLVHQPTIVLPAISSVEVRQEITLTGINEGIRELKGFAERNMKDTSRVNFFVDPGPLVLSLKKLLKQRYYHLIFAGLKGTGVLKKIFLGSTIIDLVDKLDVPVIAFPKGKHPFPSKLFVGTSHYFPLRKHHLGQILYYFKNREQSISFLTVTEDDKDKALAIEYLKELENQYKKSYRVTSLIIKDGKDSFKEIKSFMLQQKEGIFVAQRGSRTLSDYIFRKFLINDLIYQGEFPLLILP